MPRKQWAAYEKVTAADVNANLSDQSVMRFANSTARSTAIPAPTEGMVSWLDDINALQVYDGTAWVAVIGGTPGNPLGAGDPLNMGYIALASTSAADGAWVEITPGLGSAVYIFSFTIQGGSGLDVYELGTGAAGSELTRFVCGSSDFDGTGKIGNAAAHIPWGMFVPASTRIAFRRVQLSGSSTRTIDRMAIRYTTVANGTSYRAGRTAGITWPSGLWNEVASTPPLSGGVWVTGFMGSTFEWPSTSKMNGLRFGVGAAGSETAVSAVVAGSHDDLFYGTTTAMEINIQPFWWPPGTRLAVRPETTNDVRSGNVVVIWRESLS